MRSICPHESAPTVAKLPSLAEIRSVMAQLDAPGIDLLVTTSGTTLPLTNLERRLWPQGEPGGATKRDLIRYYARVSPYLLRHLSGHELRATAYPLGVAGPPRSLRPWRTCPECDRSGIAGDDRSLNAQRVEVTTLANLLWLGQRNAIALVRLEDAPAVRRGRAGTGPFPTCVEIDMARQGAGEFEVAREAAFRLRKAAECAGLMVQPSITGDEGVRCRIPAMPAPPHTREYRRLLAMLLKATGPGARAASGGLSPLTPTPDTRGLVCMPLRWTELQHARPEEFTLHTTPELLQHRGDPWLALEDALMASLAYEESPKIMDDVAARAP